MGRRPNTTKPTVEETKTTIEEIETTVEEMNEENENNEEKAINKKPLMDSDEIEVISLVPHVSYKDKQTLDTYYWDEVGHTEYMTFDVLKNMWRNSKGYFNNMWLKPNDDRVINKFGLKPKYDKYEYLMDASNYTKKNIADVCDAISNTPNSLKISVCDKIRHLVVNEEITDASVIKALEKHLKIDLMNFLN